mmetsp:Transcript_46588/g.146062  ORF Transcript_46588/g.146062 Transcript_46588/m.146062 type:complete len:268 (-) Transcript_46588:872-1675(-)
MNVTRSLRVAAVTGSPELSSIVLLAQDELRGQEASSLPVISLTGCSSSLVETKSLSLLRLSSRPPRSRPSPPLSWMSFLSRPHCSLLLPCSRALLGWSAQRLCPSPSSRSSLPSLSSVAASSPAPPAPPVAAAARAPHLVLVPPPAPPRLELQAQLVPTSLPGPESSRLAASHSHSAPCCIARPPPPGGRNLHRLPARCRSAHPQHRSRHPCSSSPHLSLPPPHCPGCSRPPSPPASFSLPPPPPPSVSSSGAPLATSSPSRIACWY